MLPQWFRFSLGVFVLSWGLAFLKYVGQPEKIIGNVGSLSIVYYSVPFPVWPNVLDAVGLIGVGMYLSYHFAQEWRLEDPGWTIAP